jgi:hypothetical protein
MGDYNTSSSGTNYTSMTTTSDQIRWVGGDIICNGVTIVCNGKSLTAVENAIALQLCTLAGSVDVTEVVIPSCFTTAWINKDKTILELFNYLLQIACEQETAIAALPTTNDPLVSVTYCCCNGSSPCSTVVTLKVSDHIQKIVSCLCDIAAQVIDISQALNSQVAVIQQVNTLQLQITNIVGAINIYNSSVTNATNQIPLNPTQANQNISTLVIPPLVPIPSFGITSTSEDPDPWRPPIVPALPSLD